MISGQPVGVKRTVRMVAGNVQPGEVSKLVDWTERFNAGHYFVRYAPVNDTNPWAGMTRQEFDRYFKGLGELAGNYHAGYGVPEKKQVDFAFSILLRGADGLYDARRNGTQSVVPKIAGLAELPTGPPYSEIANLAGGKNALIYFPHGKAPHIVELGKLVGEDVQYKDMSMAVRDVGKHLGVGVNCFLNVQDSAPPGHHQASLDGLYAFFDGMEKVTPVGPNEKWAVVRVGDYDSL